MVQARRGVEGQLEDNASMVEEVETACPPISPPGGAAISPFASRTILDGFQLSVKPGELLDTVERVRAELSSGETAPVE